MDNQRPRDEIEGARTIRTYAGGATATKAAAVGEPIDVLPGPATSDPFESAMGNGDDHKTAGGLAKKVDAGIGKAADGIDKLVGVVRVRVDQFGQSTGAAGTVGSVATTAADTLDGASRRLHRSDTVGALDDLEALIRRKPVESVLVAAGLGFAFAKALRRSFAVRRE